MKETEPEDYHFGLVWLELTYLEPVKVFIYIKLFIFVFSQQFLNVSERIVYFCILFDFARNLSLESIRRT